MTRSHWVARLAALVVATWCVPSSAALSQAADAINELDLGRAATLLESATHESLDTAFLRARLAVYRGDCDTAEAMLEPLKGPPHVQDLLQVAKNCARAVAGTKIIEDDAHAVWIRLQDDDDAALAPYIARVAGQARAAAERDLGVTLPRPLRIDLVRDLFSLSAISGLPVSAAETTGTVAVARWGRITMVSPRAAHHGFPWEDTLAHELSHLVLTRASRDYAPLWLQEGVAKRQEVRWRSARPFDKQPSAHERAREGLVSGTSVGVTNLGNSIALLPSPEQASMAYAEVESFVSFWIDENGTQAFQLLLHDLKGLADRDSDRAMRSVSGYGLDAWITRWQRWLVATPAPTPPSVSARARSVDYGAVARQVRLGQLTFAEPSLDTSTRQFDAALQGVPKDPTLRFYAARNRMADAELDSAAAVIGPLEQVNSLNGRWLALRAAADAYQGQSVPAGAHAALAIGLDPYAIEVACGGTNPEWPHGKAGRSKGPVPAPPSEDQKRLCESALRISREKTAN